MVDLEDTELTLGLPGGSGRRREVVVSGGQKRGFVENVDFDFFSSDGESSIDHVNGDHKYSEITTEATSQAPAKKAQVIGWPPVRSFRKKVFGEGKECKYVKVAADGAPYLRKVDLETFDSYRELLRALKGMFSCFNIRDGICEQGKSGKPQVKGMVEHVPTYEDKDGDLMLVGDVPWKMFTESCRRIRLMKSSEAVWLAPRTSQDE